MPFPVVSSRSSTLRCTILIILACWPLSGCSCNQVQEFAPTKEVELLHKLQSAYELAYNEKKGPLKDFKDLQPFLGGIQDPSTELVSPNDGLPYVILYGIDRRDFSQGTPVYAYEQKGSGGVRRVLTAMSIESMDEATFQKHVPSAAGTK